jgi:glycosyltransferase involved in cell wall biosynthesis
VPRVAFTLEQCWHRVPGGTAVAAIELARALREHPAVELIGVAARHRRPAPAQYTPPIAVEQLPLPRLALYEAWHWLRSPRVERATGPVDLVHATSIAIPPKSAPLVVTVHDLAFLHEPSHFTRRGLSFFRRGLELAMRDAGLVICVSHSTLRDCINAGFDPDRLLTIPLGVDMARAKGDDVDRVKKTYGLNRPYVMWTGTIEPRKNLRGVVEAFGALPSKSGLDLVLVGPKGWNEDIDALVAPARERIRVLGFVPRADLAPLYAGAAVFCWPSLREGFGFPVLEAMTQGTPVVTSKGTSTEELATGAGVLVNPLDSEEIAAGLRSVLEDDAFAAKLSDAGLGRAAEYSWSRTARLTADAYARVIGRRQ